MNENLKPLEEIISDENFQAWFHKNDDLKAKKWVEWTQVNAGHDEIINEAISFLENISIAEKSISSSQLDAALQKLNDNLYKAKVKRIPSAIKSWLIPAAAAILLIVGLVIWKSGASRTILGSTYGKTSEYKLPDGSIVMLNANSKITLNKLWEAGSDREVWLKGEAYFHVVKTSQHNRFVVHGNNMDIIVTGTRFNVVNRDDESSVLLTEGSVIIKTSDGNEIHMKPGDFVKVENKIVAKEPVNEEKVLAWQQNKLVFDNTTMTEVAAVITRYYGVSVVFADSTIGNKRIGGVMPNDNLDVLIQSLRATSEFQIVKKDNEIILSIP